MKDQILNLGKVLSKAEQKEIGGGIGSQAPCDVSRANYRPEGGDACSYPSNIQGPFPGSRCFGTIHPVDGRCYVD